MRNLYRNGAEDGLAIGRVEHLPQARRLPAPVGDEAGPPSCQCPPRPAPTLVPLPDPLADLDRTPIDRTSSGPDRHPTPPDPAPPLVGVTDRRLRVGRDETEYHPFDRRYDESGQTRSDQTRSDHTRSDHTRSDRTRSGQTDPGQEAAHERARLQVIEAAACFGAMADAVDEAAADVLGVNRTDLTILRALHRHGHSTAGEAATAAGLSAPATTAAIQRLAAAGLLAREVDPADRRRAVLTLTPAAAQRIEQVYGAARAQHPGHLTSYSVEELAVVERFLTDGIAVQQQQACRIRSL